MIQECLLLVQGQQEPLLVQEYLLLVQEYLLLVQEYLLLVQGQTSLLSLVLHLLMHQLRIHSDK